MKPSDLSKTLNDEILIVHKAVAALNGDSDLKILRKLILQTKDTLGKLDYILGEKSIEKASKIKTNFIRSSFERSIVDKILIQEMLKEDLRELEKSYLDTKKYITDTKVEPQVKKLLASIRNKSHKKIDALSSLLIKKLKTELHGNQEVFNFLNANPEVLKDFTGILSQDAIRKRLKRSN